MGGQNSLNEQETMLAELKKELRDLVNRPCLVGLSWAVSCLGLGCGRGAPHVEYMAR
jgi:hypothetical protein